MAHDIFIDNFIKNAFGMHDVATQVARLNQPVKTFPPYNIIVNDRLNPTKYTLECAVAGFTRDQISVKIKKENGLSILAIKGSKPPPAGDATIYQVQGLATRAFSREFTMSDSIKVDSVQLADGILTVNLSTQQVLQRETILQIE
jgi:molecular chaperone IbpA